MKLTLTQNEKTVTIETPFDGQGVSEMVNEMRCLLMAQDYHPDNISALMPTEHELDEIISDALEEQKNEDFLEKELDSQEILVHPTA